MADTRARLPRGHSPKTSIRQVCLMSFSFCLTFLAFSSAQNFATSRSGSVGSTSLGILYSVFTACNIVASAAVRKLGPKLSLILGSITYATFVAANIVYEWYTMYPAAVALGVGAALIWTAEGVYITRCAVFHEMSNGLPERSTIGLFNGIFFLIFQTNQFLGNLLVALLFLQDVATSIIFTITTCIAICGTVVMLFIKNMSHPDDEKHLQEDDSPIMEAEMVAPVESPRINIMDTLHLLSDLRLQLLIPIMIYSGLSQAVLFGEYPHLIKDDAIKFFVMAVFGIPIALFVLYYDSLSNTGASDAVFSFLFGKASDTVGRRVILYAGAIVHAAVFLFLLFFEISQSTDERWIFFCGAILLGLGDAVFNTQLYAILGSFFESRSEAAFSNFKLFQSCATAAAFFYSDHLSLDVKLLMALGFLTVGMLFLAVLDKFVSGGSLRRRTVETKEYEHLDESSDDAETVRFI